MSSDEPTRNEVRKASKLFIMMDSLYSFFRTPSSTSVPDDELPDSNELFSTTGPCGIATLFDPEDPLLE